MDLFVEPNSVVRKIWGKADTILFIFAGSAAEFALNKAVDWLYFTGKLPADPLGRLFSTVAYARQIVFSEREAANKAIDKITAIHSAIETSRGAAIPDWAYRDVLFMLIDYSIRSFELLERKLTLNEKTEVFDVFWRVGDRMHLKGLPVNFDEWTLMRKQHLESDLEKSHYTADLYKQYKKHLGVIRFKILVEGQKLVIPPTVLRLLEFKKWSLLVPVVAVYILFRKINLEWVLKDIVLPADYKAEIKSLDVVKPTV